VAHNFDIETIKKVAYLARLGIPDSELPSYTKDLSNILALVDQINAEEINKATENVPPMSHPYTNQSVIRDDEVTEVVDPATLQLYENIAPLMDGNLYLVSKAL